MGSHIRSPKRSAALKAIASRLVTPTKTAARAALKEAGMKLSLADELLAAYGEIANLRKRAVAARIERRLGHEIHWRSAFDSPGRRRGRMPVRLPQGTPEQRLKALRRNLVHALFCNSYRTATHGGQSVALITNPTDVGVRQSERYDWDVYAKSYKHGPARVQDTLITVPADWRIRVQRRSIDVVDGMMTLDAAPLEGAPAGVELFAATWVEQGRGTSVSTVSGYIARAGQFNYHGETAAKALAGLRRKIGAAEWMSTLQTSNLADLVAKARDALVRVADAKAVGACEYGIRSWCATVGISYEAGAAPLPMVYAAYQREPRPEARAAILHALRRHRCAVVAFARAKDV